MTTVRCLHDLIDHLARNGAVIVLSPFNSAEIAPSVDLGKLELVEWPVKQFNFGSDSVSSSGWKQIEPVSSGNGDDVQ